MVITIIYHSCYMVVDLVFCLEAKELWDLVLSPQFADIFQLLFFFDLSANYFF